jgi:putative hydrolase of the HAD superfamily
MTSSKTISRTTIRAVLFDYGLVLSGPPDPTALVRLEALLGADSARFDDAYWKSRDAYDRGHLNGASYWKRVADDLQQPLGSETLSQLVEADTALWTVPNQPMIDWAMTLQRAGLRIGILSNLGDTMEAGIRRRFGWIEIFDHHTFSHRLGIAKPDLAIYRHAAEGLAVPPDQILFVDDREPNIEAARAAGMAAIRYSSHAQFVAELSAAALEGVPLPVVPNPEAGQNS